MTSTYTTNKYLEEPGHGDQVNTWDGTLNTNFSRIDAAFGAVSSINLNGVSGTLDLTNAYPIPSSAPYSYIAPTIKLSGAPSNNVTIRVPSGVGGQWTVVAAFTGSYTVTFGNIAGGSSVVLAQGYNNLVISDGTNIVSASSVGGRSVGTSANNLVALDSNAKLPAVDGSQLVNVSGVPAGTILPFAGVSEPAGWAFCDGRSMSVASYPNLYAAIGATYGSGGAGTFNLPDLRGRAPVGKDNMGGNSAGRITPSGSGITGTSLGATGGQESVTLTINQIPPHTHSYAWYQGNGGGGKTDGGGVTAGTTGSAGGGAAHTNVQPTLIINYIIKAY